MTEPPRRKWLQVHLSTAVVLMFVAGGIVWPNVIEHSKRETILRAGAAYFTITLRYGWPMDAAGSGYYLTPNKGEVVETPLHVSAAGLACDLAVALAILFAVWFVCESWIRWRTWRKREKS